MSILSAILDKLGLGNKEKPKPATPAQTAAPTGQPKPAEHKPAGPAHMGEHRPTAPAHTPATSQPKPGTPPYKPSPAQAAAQMHIAPEPEAPAPAPKPEPMAMVDVYGKLEAMAAARADKPNWKTSIADLLFMLGMDHSYQARKELAIELGCPPKLMEDSAQMNMWLHKTVLTKIAENGGNIPKEMLDN